MIAVSSPVSAFTSKTASGSVPPGPASYSRIRRSRTDPKVAPSEEAVTRTRSTDGSSAARSASMVSVSPSPTRFFGSRRTRPEGWRGWL